MTPPDHVDVGPYRYTVTVDPVDVMAARAKDSPTLVGATDLQQLVIVVDNEPAVGYQRDTLLHECLHAVLSQTGIAAELGGEKEEQFVTRLSPALLDLLRRNPQLVAFLVGTTEDS